MEENNIEFDYNKLTPFKWFVLENFPYIEADFDALTNWQLFCKLGNEINKIIESQNLVGEQAETLTTAFNNLYSYVSNYFENLNVQTEINNKLDEMVQDGTFTNLITPYINNQIMPTINQEFAEQNATIENINRKVNAIENINPIPVSSTSDMTDTTKVYLNTTNGYWYYYDGDSWEQGGLYQSASIDSDYNELVKIEYITEIENKYVQRTTGNLISDSNYTTIEIQCLPGFKFLYNEGHDESQAGCAFYNGTTFISGLAGTENAQVVTAPENTTKARFSYRTADGDTNLLKFLGSVFDIVNKIETMDGQIPKNYSELVKVKYITNTEGKYLQVSSGALITSASYGIIQIPVVSGTKFLYNEGHNETQAGVGFYKDEVSTSSYISGVVATASQQTITVPDNCNIAVFSYRITDGYTNLVNYLGSVFDIINTLNSINKLEEVELILPELSVAYVGREWNLYFDNITKNMNYDKYFIHCTVTSSINTQRCKQFDRFLRITPNAGDVGNKTIGIEIRDKKTNKIINQASFTLAIKNDTIENSTNVIFIGDSLINEGTIVAQIENILNTNINSLGTITKTVQLSGNSYNIAMEGRSGWASYDYTRTNGTYSETFPNPFWNDLANEFDFSYYVQNQNYTDIKAVCIGLGTNGSKNITENLEALDIMIDSIHDYDSTIKILITLITPPATQDGCGYHNGLQNADILKYRHLELNKAYLEHFADETNVDIIELYFNLDREMDFATTQIQASSRNPSLITVQTNDVHPSTYGYLKMADTYYNRLIHNLVTE